MRRWFLKAIAALALFFASASIAAYAYLRRSLPEIDGVVVVDGLSASVEIVRDADAIPHIFAANVPDALFGLGYAHAQDRLWQMEFQRRIGHGRLSEIFGPATIPQDRFLRTVGFGRAARSAWERMPSWAKERIDAYVAGVNALIHATHGSRLPPEFTLLRFEPEPWSGVDVIVWVKMMAWDLSSNYSLELLRDELIRAVGMERMQQLMPPYPVDGLSILAEPTDVTGIDRGISKRLSKNAGSVSAVDPVRGSTPAADELFSDAVTSALSQGHPAVRDLLLGGALNEALGSNNWVVDGTLTATGRPLLANDTHLGAQIPSIWYLAHLSAGDLDVAGATLPGIPAVALGRNRYVAWGVTNAYADVQDVYRERLDPSGRTAQFRGTDEPLTIVPETILVKGGSPVRADVRLTRHGPLISDAINANNAALPRNPRPQVLEPLALRWTALDPDDSTLPTFLKLNEARNWDEFTGALRDFVVPSQNFVYADVNGHIGYYATGRIPVRARGDGTLPVAGWSGDDEWVGWVPFEKLPHAADPASHFVVTANHRPVPDGYPYAIATDWADPYRAMRITELLSGLNFTPEDFARIQGDTVSVHARQAMPLLVRHAHPESSEARQAIGLLRQWNGDLQASSNAAAIFEAWFLKLPSRLVEDSLGARTTSSYAGRLRFVARFLMKTLNDNDPFWCDDVRTPVSETCDEIVTMALDDALVDLRQRLGSDMNLWRWDVVHRAIFPHQGLNAIAALRPLLSRSVPNGGDWSTVNVGIVSTERPYDQLAVAGYRAILDLSPGGDSRFGIDVGQSGHPLSRHYADLLEDWRAVRHRRMRMERADIEESALGHLRLVPASH